MDVRNIPLRIAVYIRLSTDKIHQRVIYEKTVGDYRRYIEQFKKWELAKVYTDEGSNDSLSENMREFRRMIDDCKAGKIDVIFTKSLLQFSDNSSMAVSKIIQLAELSPPIGVFFENEGCFSLELNYKLALHILHLFLEAKKKKQLTQSNFGLENEGWYFN